MDWQRLLPVIVSIVVIITIAVTRAYSRTLAAITATMPINIALTLWIVYSAENGDKVRFAEFARSLMEGLVPTVLFMFTAWMAARAGWDILPVLVAGYVAWAIGLGIVFWLFGL